jgi:hypothetical protein
LTKPLNHININQTTKLQILFDMDSVLYSRQKMPKIASKALFNVSEDVSSSVEKAFGVAEFARTLALQIQAKFGGGRVMRFT